MGTYFVNLFIKFCIDIFRKRKLGAGSLTGVRFPALLVFACQKEGSGEIFIWNNFDTSCCFRMESSIALQTTEGKEDKLLDEVKISVINIGTIYLLTQSVIFRTKPSTTRQTTEGRKTSC